MRRQRCAVRAYAALRFALAGQVFNHYKSRQPYPLRHAENRRARSQSPASTVDGGAESSKAVDTPGPASPTEQPAPALMSSPPRGSGGAAAEPKPLSSTNDGPNRAGMVATTPPRSISLREPVLQRSGSELQLDIGPPTPTPLSEDDSKQEPPPMVRAATVSNDEELIQRQQAWLQQQIESLECPPFTLQRVCELLCDPLRSVCRHRCAGAASYDEIAVVWVHLSTSKPHAPANWHQDTRAPAVARTLTGAMCDASACRGLGRRSTNTSPVALSRGASSILF